jgi:hypothetical protein
MRLFFTFCCLLLFRIGFAQGVGIGTASPDSSTVLDIRSSVKGILIPRMETFDIERVSKPAKGLMIYDSLRNMLMVNMGSVVVPDWEPISAYNSWGTGGNVGTDSGNQFIGTRDDAPLRFVAGGLFAGLLDAKGANTSFGVNAANPNSDLINNTAIGYNALAINQEGDNNTAVGVNSLRFNIAGEDNVAIGHNALEENTSGTENVALGEGTLRDNLTGNQNCAVGNFSLTRNLSGLGNTAVGAQSLGNTTNSYFNTVVGANSGSTFDNGYNNVFLGANCDVTSAGLFNVIAIGQGVICTASSQARIGNSATNSIGGYANWTNFSDGRYKKNMKENVKGIDFIMRLRPLTYNLDMTGIQNKLGNKRPTDAGSQQAIAEKEAMVFSGFAAQEVEQAAQAAGYDFSGVDKPKNANDFYGLRYADFVVPLVKGMQEQQMMINTLIKRLDELEKDNKALTTLLNTKK